MMRVLVTGGAGFLGRRVVAALVARGHDVVALARPSRVVDPDMFPPGVEVARGDLRLARSIPPALAGVEAVVHLAAAVTGDDDSQFAHTVVGAENLLAAMEHEGVPRLVHCSSFSVYDWRRASSPLTEDSPLEERLYDRDGYAIAKTWQERLVRRDAEANGRRLTVIRPGFIWGAGATDLSGVGHAFERWRIVVGGTRALPLTYVENCAECFAVALDHPAAVGETFNVVDGPPVSAWRFQGDALAHCASRGRRVYVPYVAGLAAAALATGIVKLRFRGRGKLPGLLVPAKYRARFRPLTFAADKLSRVLGYRQRFSYAEAWRQVAHGSFAAMDAPAPTDRVDPRPEALARV